MGGEPSSEQSSDRSSDAHDEHSHRFTSLSRNQAVLAWATRKTIRPEGRIGDLISLYVKLCEAST